jgi:hypothetical protein
MAKGDAGEVVAPAGSPKSEIVTGLVKPPCGVMETESEAVPPATAVMLDGDTAMLKFCAASTETGRPAEWVRAPEVPLAESE